MLPGCCRRLHTAVRLTEVYVCGFVCLCVCVCVCGCVCACVPAGCVGSLNTATGGIGPILASALFVAGVGSGEDDVTTHPRGVVDIGAGACFYAAAAMFAIAGAGAIVLHRRYAEGRLQPPSAASTAHRGSTDVGDRFIELGPAVAAPSSGADGSAAAAGGSSDAQHAPSQHVAAAGNDVESAW